MGLLDVLNGIQNGPRGQLGPSTSSRGMSPLTMAVLGLLAYKALKHFSGQQGATPTGSGGTKVPSPGGTKTPTPPYTGTPNVGASTSATPGEKQSA